MRWSSFVVVVTLTGCLDFPHGYEPIERLGPAFVAANDSGALVVWSDYYRDSVGESLTGLRLLAQLVVGGKRTPPAIVIGQGFVDAVTWDVAQWVVADAFTVTRVDPEAGSFTSTALPSLDVTGDASTEPSRVGAALACGEAGCLVVLAIARGGLPSGITGVRIDHDGNVLDAIPFPIADGAVYRPRVAFDGTQYWVIWSGHYDANRLTEELDGVRIGEDGAIVGSTVTLASGLHPEGFPASPGGVPASLACAQGECLVIWSGTPDASDSLIAGRRVDAAGGLVDPQAIGIVPRACGSSGTIVAFDGASYLVGGKCGATDPTYATLVSSAGVVLGRTGTVTDAVGEISPSIAGAAGELFAIWENASSEIRGARIAGDGHVLDPRGILIGTMGESTR
jgi:hypothetical protein